MFRNKKGFTLIELIVVIAVLSIIVTMGIPRYLGQSRDAFETRLKHDAKLIQDACDRYYVDYNEWPYLNENEPIEFTEDTVIFHKVIDYNETKLSTGKTKLYNIDFDKIKSYVRIKSDPKYFVAAVGEPEFSVTVLGLESNKDTNNPITPSEPIRDPVEGEVIINTPEDLDSIRDNLSGNYILMSDIDLSKYENWTPIGTDTNPFTGSLDGNGFKITNLKINRTADHTGLFGYTSGAKLSNIALENVDVTGGRYTGGLVGVNWDGSITNSYSTGTVSGGNSTGGLVGFNQGPITNSYSTGTVSGTGDTGGLVGSNYGTITNSYSTGTVSGTGDRTGGLVGWNNGSITNSYSTGTVSGRSWTGGLAGANQYGSITNSYSTGAVTGTGSTGGLVGYNDRGPITNSYSTGTVSGTGSTGGLVGRNYNGTITNSYTTGTLYNSNVGGTISGNKSNIPVAEMKQKATFTNLDFTNTWEIIEDESYPFLKSNPQTPPPGTN